MLVEEKLSVRQACKIVHIARSLIVYRKKQRDDGSLIEALHELVAKHPSIGFWKCYYRLRRQGVVCNHKRLYRVYTMLGLNVRRRAKRRLPKRIKEPLCLPAALNQSWSMDFVCDSLVDGRRFRILNIIDDYNRDHWPLKSIHHCHHSESSEFLSGSLKQERSQNKSESITDRNLSVTDCKAGASREALN